jgi:hypothetical protein
METNAKRRRRMERKIVAPTTMTGVFDFVDCRYNI